MLGRSTRRCLIEFTCASYNGIVPSDCQELKELCCLLRTSCCSEVIVRMNEYEVSVLSSFQKKKKWVKNQVDIDLAGKNLEKTL